MARMSQAPGLILTAPYAFAPAIAMAVRTAAAQGESRRRRRNSGGQNGDTEQQVPKHFHKSLLLIRDYDQSHSQYGS
jgi:hypothetical protein